MRIPVCPGDGEANKVDDDIAIRSEDMEQAVSLGIVPDEAIAAGKPFVTHDEMRLYTMDDETHYMSTGMTAWRAIAFASERGLDLPIWVRRYLEQSAQGIEEWAACNGHPSELKDILLLKGKRQHDREESDPRWVYDAISQMKEQRPKASISSLSQEYLKLHAGLSYSEEAIRQKYYEGKKLSETGQDYKGRGRKGNLIGSPHMSRINTDEEVDF